MTLPAADIETRRQTALADCQTMIDWFNRNKRRARNFFYISQVCTIVLSALTPVLILWSDIPKAAQALPAAIASIAAALNAVFRWREHWVIRAHASEALKLEMLKFKTRTSEEYMAGLDDQKALSNFVTRIESLSMNEVSEWRALQLQAIKESNSAK
jgi:hypothetical protein